MRPGEPTAFLITFTGIMVFALNRQPCAVGQGASSVPQVTHQQVLALPFKILHCF